MSAIKPSSDGISKHIIGQHKPILIISLTQAGKLLAERICMELSYVLGADTSVRCSHKPQPFKEKVQQAFVSGHHLIFICATGIVMRTLAPVIANKQQDPAVLVLDEMGRFIIPLLSGHEGGANQLANSVAQVLDGQLVLTTANSYLQPYYTVGLGCERGCSTENLMALLQHSVTLAGLKVSDIRCIASIDIKGDEVGMIELAETLKLPFKCYSAQQLQEVQSQLQTPSQYVYETVGVYGVAESAALISAQFRPDKENQQLIDPNTYAHERRAPSELLLAKQKSKVATCAIARSYAIGNDAMH